MNSFFNAEVEKAVTVLKSGGVMLYPTDTIWGLGCDATNEAAVEKIYTIKSRPETKSLIILIAEVRDLLHYVAAPDPAVSGYLEQQTKPTTIVFENAIGLAPNVVAADGSVAIRIVNDDFCRHFIKRLRKPVVSTSANESGKPAPQTFSGILPFVKKAVDHIVQWRQNETVPAKPSRLVKWNNDGTVTVLRP